MTAHTYCDTSWLMSIAMYPNKNWNGPLVFLVIFFTSTKGVCFMQNIESKNKPLLLPEAILFIGLQASGKTSFYQKSFSSMYIHINLDTLHTRNKERLLLEKCFSNGKSFVVDNTNPTILSRSGYIRAAKEHGYRVIGYFFQSILADCIARNQLRTGKACLPNIALASVSKQLELPSYQEGFDSLYFVRLTDSEFCIEPWQT